MEALNNSIVQIIGSYICDGSAGIIFPNRSIVVKSADIRLFIECSIGDLISYPGLIEDLIGKNICDIIYELVVNYDFHIYSENSGRRKPERFSSELFILKETSIFNDLRLPNFENRFGVLIDDPGLGCVIRELLRGDLLNFAVCMALWRTDSNFETYVEKLIKINNNIRLYPPIVKYHKHYDFLEMYYMMADYISELKVNDSGQKYVTEFINQCYDCIGQRDIEISFDKFYKYDACATICNTICFCVDVDGYNNSNPIKLNVGYDRLVELYKENPKKYTELAKGLMKFYSSAE